MPLAPELGSEWVEPTVKKHTLLNSGLKEKIVRQRAPSKPHTTPAIEAPHPGKA